MKNSLVRLGICLPAIMLLTGGFALLGTLHNTAPSAYQPQTHLEADWFHANLRVSAVNTQKSKTCDCAKADYGTQTAPKAEKCVRLAPAERMGMTSRLVSL